jgi:hypothetical protein
MSILDQLLNKLKEQTNYCPYCDGEYVCDEECILKELWFYRDYTGD